MTKKTSRKLLTSNPSNPDKVKVTGNGIYANAGAAQASLGFSTDRTAWGSIIGYVRRAITKATNDIHASIIGLSAIDDAHAAFFKHMANGKSLVVEGESNLMGIIKTKDGSGEYTGLSGRFVYTSASGSQFRHMTFKNGLLVEEGAGT